MAIWFAQDPWSRVGAWPGGTLIEHLGIRITAIGDDWVEGTMPVDARTRQPYGVLHGGASAALAETLGSFAANLVLDPALGHAVGQELNASHVRPALEGLVTGRARPAHLGRRSQVWTIEIRNAAGQLTCLARLTMAVLAGAEPGR